MGCLVRSCLLVGAIAVALPGAPDAQASPPVATRARIHRRAHHRSRVARSAPAPGYGTTYSPSPDCRYPDGTPFDPDIIGGPNHVGDGGPAVNLGGFAPCGY